VFAKPCPKPYIAPISFSFGLDITPGSCVKNKKNDECGGFNMTSACCLKIPSGHLT